MAIGVIVDGPCEVKVGTGSAGALESLGFSIDGVTIEEDVRTLDVPGDQNGGSEGPPIDVQYLGQIDIVRIELSKYDPAIVAKLQPRLLGGTAGVVGTPGTLIAAGSLFHRLLLLPTNRPRNYVAAIPRGQPITSNKGTKFTRLSLTFECHAFSGTLWNTTTT